ncbi:MAG: helix-turn-helix transcriptional regulator [Bacilli bacterium]|nr:helix-turn-helix transcriptional regulator [Bacilli bacterium]
MYVESFSSKLKKARNDTGFTQREVARETGISQPNIARYETGVLEPNIETLGILADFYGVSVDWLLGTAGGKNNPLHNGKTSIA